MALKRISYDRAQEIIGEEGDFNENFQEQENTNNVYKSIVLKELLEDNLTSKQKCYILLYYRDGLTLKEIADKFGVCSSTVSRTIQKGRERMLSGVKKQAFRRLLGEDLKK